MFLLPQNETYTHLSLTTVSVKVKTHVMKIFFFNFWEKIKKNDAKTSLVGKILNLITRLLGTIIHFLLKTQLCLGYEKTSISLIKKEYGIHFWNTHYPRHLCGKTFSKFSNFFTLHREISWFSCFQVKSQKCSESSQK